jgi:protein-tyrosine phosphatase
VSRDDFEDFDLLLAMDRSNLRELRRMAPDEQARGKVRLLREFDPASRGRGPAGAGSGDPDASERDADVPEPDLDVPDPYYGAAGGFDEVLDLVQAACAGLLDEIRPRERT